MTPISQIFLWPGPHGLMVNFSRRKDLKIETKQKKNEGYYEDRRAVLTSG